MEQFKASDEDWQTVEALGEGLCGEGHRTIRELRDRVAALEAAPDRVLVRNQTGEYLRAGTPVYLAAPAKAVPSDEELWEVQLKVKSQSRPHIGWQVWSPESEPLIAAHRALYDHGYEQGLAAGRAEQPATTEPPTDSEPEPKPSDFQTLHGIALDMVDSLRPIVIPEILNVLRRAIREPAPCPHIRSSGDSNWCALAEQQAAAEATPEPEPSPSPAEDAGLVRQVAIAIGGDDWEIWGEESRDVIRIVARWLRKKRYYLAAALLEPEANR